MATKKEINNWREIIEQVFRADEARFPLTISWDTGETIPDLKTKGRCKLDVGPLIILHKKGLTFSITRILIAECSKTASINPQGPRACSDNDAISIGVNVRIIDGKLTFLNDPKVDASKNTCIDGTRGIYSVLDLFNQFRGIDLTP